MHIEMPDPHPGRCKNYRNVHGHQVRCLDYEGKPHTCSFDAVDPWAVESFLKEFVLDYRSTKPKPWTRPERAASDSALERQNRNRLDENGNPYR